MYPAIQASNLQRHMSSDLNDKNQLKPNFLKNVRSRDTVKTESNLHQEKMQ